MDKYISLKYIFIVIIILVTVLIYLHIHSKRSFNYPVNFVIITAFIFVSIGFLSMHIQKTRNQKTHYTNHLSNYKKVFLRINKILKPNKYYKRYEADVIQINNEITKGKVNLSIYEDTIPNRLRIDETLFTNNSFKKIRKAKNPNEFDYQNYLKKKQIYHQLNLTNKDFLIINSNQRTVKGVTYNIRENINKNIKKYGFSKEVLAIINALLLGQRNDISKKQSEQYKDAGAIHILAVSGLHIGIILIFLNFVFRFFENLKNGKIIKLVCVVICLWLYAFLAGMSASVVRAVTMFSTIAIALAVNRPFGVKNSLFVSFFFLILLNPLFLFDVGFQLSYLAVFSIIWLQPIIKEIWNPRWKIVTYFWELLTVSLAAQLGILPLSLFYFHQFPGLFFISSLVIIPLLGIIIGLGFLIIILSTFNILPLILANIYGFIIEMMNNFIAYIAQKESFIFQNISFSLLLMLTFYIFLIGSVNWLQNKTIKNLYVFLTAVILFQGCFIYEKFKVQFTNEFIVFHQSKKTIIGIRKGSTMKVFQNFNTVGKTGYSPLQAYKRKYRNIQLQIESSEINILEFNNKNVLIIDNSGIYDTLKLSPKIVVLTQSPKINLDRMIKRLQPGLIITDGSNYKSYSKLWEKSCKKNAIKFHDTSNKGAFAYAF